MFHISLSHFAMTPAMKKDFPRVFSLREIYLFKRNYITTKRPAKEKSSF